MLFSLLVFALFACATKGQTSDSSQNDALTLRVENMDRATASKPGPGHLRRLDLNTPYAAIADVYRDKFARRGRPRKAVFEQFRDELQPPKDRPWYDPILLSEYSEDELRNLYMLTRDARVRHGHPDRIFLQKTRQGKLIYDPLNRTFGDLNENICVNQRKWRKKRKDKRLSEERNYEREPILSDKQRAKLCKSLNKPGLADIRNTRNFKQPSAIKPHAPKTSSPDRHVIHASSAAEPSSCSVSGKKRAADQADLLDGTSLQAPSLQMSLEGKSERSKRSQFYFRRRLQRVMEEDPDAIYHMATGGNCHGRAPILPNKQGWTNANWMMWQFSMHKVSQAELRAYMTKFSLSRLDMHPETVLRYPRQRARMGSISIEALDRNPKGGRVSGRKTTEASSSVTTNLDEQAHPSTDPNTRDANCSPVDCRGGARRHER